MKKFISVILTLVMMLSMITIVQAAEIAIKDVLVKSHEIEILTESGNVYSSEKDITTQNKRFVIDGVSAIYDNYFVKTNGDLHDRNNGEIIKGLNAKNVINSFDCSYYISEYKSNENRVSAKAILYINKNDDLLLYVYNDKGDSKSTLMQEKVLETIGRHPNSLYNRNIVLKSNGELYSYLIFFKRDEVYNDFSEMYNKALESLGQKFLASDILDISYGSNDDKYFALKNNGELLSHDARKETTEVIATNINTSIGLTTYRYNGYFFENIDAIKDAYDIADDDEDWKDIEKDGM